MSFSMAPLLLHSADLPNDVRERLQAAMVEPAQRDEHLVAAARMMHHQLALECSDALELVGLPAGRCS